MPVIQAIKAKYDVLISIDTYKTATARAALEAGADILNDVWAGLYDGQMLALAAEKNVPIILMHNQKEEVYNDVTEDVCTFLSQRAQAALGSRCGQGQTFYDILGNCSDTVTIDEDGWGDFPVSEKSVSVWTIQD